MSFEDPRVPPVELARLNAKHALRLFQGSLQGLSEYEAQARLARYGENCLPLAKAPSLLGIFFKQLLTPFSLVLLFATGVSGATAGWHDALIIFAVLLVNSVIGTFHERRANRALSALRQTLLPMSRVLRENQRKSVETEQLVPGDVVLLQEGDRVPADGRLIECQGLHVDESALTGEFMPITKTARALKTEGQAPLGDIRNMVYSGTHVVSGKGTMLVTHTGSQTQIGLIAQSLTARREDPPLIQQMKRLSQRLLIGVAFYVLLLFAISFWRNGTTEIILPTLLSLAVAIIPEGLPIVVTIVLAREVYAMSKQQAVIKNLHAIETLSAVDVICTDKTGTLTKNELRVQEAWTPEGTQEKDLAQACRLLVPDEYFDPIDRAFVNYANAFPGDRSVWTLLEDSPFDYVSRLRARRLEHPEQGVWAFLAGSPEAVLQVCKDYDQLAANVELQRLTKQGMRVIAFAQADNPSSLKSVSWVFVGFLALQDELRPLVKESLEWCKAQHIRTVMLTGDHPETALAIGKQLGMAHRRDEVVTGQEIDQMIPEDLAKKLLQYHIFARITPLHKEQIVRAYQALGLRVAVTGDGVNDAPALHAAHIGIAMGRSGTDVAREAADIVLLDDHFSTIVVAIKGARTVTTNIRKVVNYLLATNFAEALVIGVTVVLSLPLPLTPIQILWLNLVTDVFLVIALSAEPPHERTGYHGRRVEMLDNKAMFRIVLMVFAMSIMSLSVYIVSLDQTPIFRQTLVLFALATAQWWNAWNSRSESRSLFRLNPLANLPLLFATLFVLGLQLLVQGVAPFQRLLGITSLPVPVLVLTALLMGFVVFADELRKFALRFRGVLRY